MSPATDGPAAGRGGSTIEAGQAAAAALFLSRLERESPFVAGGQLDRGDVQLMRTLEADDLGRAITLLIRHARDLHASLTATAAEAIVDVIYGSGARVRANLELPQLIEFYRQLEGDPSHQAINRAIARLLRGTNYDAALIELGADAAAISLRRSIRQAIASLDQPAQGQIPTLTRRTRGLTAPPAPAPGAGFAMAEPPSGEASDERPAFQVTALDPGEARPGSDGTVRRKLIHLESEAEPPKYRAYGLLACDETVLVGRPFEVEVGLSPKQQARVEGEAFNVPLPIIETYNLDIQLYADGFDLIDDEAWRNTREVSLNSLYPTVTLHLIARPIVDPQMDRTITATFTIKGEVLGKATRHLIVTQDATVVPTIAPRPPATGANVSAPSGLPPADITIVIKKGDERGVFVWGVESNLDGVGLPPDRPPETDIGNDPEAFMKDLIGDLMQEQQEEDGLAEYLQGKAIQIRDAMPAQVRDAIRAATAAVAPATLNILLLTAEPYVPWELAYVDDPPDSSAPPYLGAQANIGRWVLDAGATQPDPPRTLNASSMAVVWGTYSGPTLPRLEGAEDEARVMQETYHAASIDALRAPVLLLLRGVPESDILHFAVHGKYNPNGADEGLILVKGTSIKPEHILGSNLNGRRPFVFLNACQVAAATSVLGIYSGIAEAFLRVGASAVVAPLWSVDDATAHDVALKFYEHALAAAPAAGDAEAPGPTVADLLRKVRSELISDVDVPDATYLAYQFYGHPSLRLSWKQAPASGGQVDG